MLVYDYSVYHEHHVVNGTGGRRVNVAYLFLDFVKSVSSLRAECPALIDQLFVSNTRVMINIIIP